MNKLMMFLIAATAAVTAQCASVNWVVSNVYTPSTSILAPGSSGGGAKMTVAEAANLVISVYWDSNKGSGDANWSLINDSATLTGAGTKSSSVLWTQATAVENRNDDYYAYFKVALEYSFGGVTYTTEKLSGAVDLANITSQAKAVTFNMNNLAWTAVPEPCSVALVLLGVAALGLKRKIA